jgi:hypothetical protein
VSQNRTTIHLVIQLKAMLTINVEKYLKIQFIHKLALIFYPKRKDLKILNESDREVIEFTKTSLKIISTNSLTEKSSQTSESKPKKCKMSLSEAFLYESDEE